MNILVTGGAGYIGSHTLLELIRFGYSVVVVDNLSNSSHESLHHVETITGITVPFYNVDIRNKEELEKVFTTHSFDCCIHFAGFKSMGESLIKPWEYYENNINGTLVLLDVMRKQGCKNIIFSSSAMVYGDAPTLPVSEECAKGTCTNPYGKTKSIIEDILIDMYNADVKSGDKHPWNVVLLRYFNPIGAHSSGLIGEDSNGIPNNLMPSITQVAIGKLDKLHIYGNDYETTDGTCIRDYIHVMDLAKGHVKALKAIKENCGVAIYNLGTGKGYSVLDVVHAFEQANGIKIPYVFDSRRQGDVAVSYSDPSKANRELGWKAEKDIYDMCRDSWNWQKKNPEGYLTKWVDS